jgi:hypothetical protein
MLNLLTVLCGPPLYYMLEGPKEADTVSEIFASVYSYAVVLLGYGRILEATISRYGQKVFACTATDKL